MENNDFSESLQAILQIISVRIKGVDLSSLREVNRGFTSAKEIRMTYTVRNAILKSKGSSLRGYDELEPILFSLAEDRSVEFIHLKNKEITISIFMLDGRVIGYFYYYLLETH